MREIILTRGQVALVDDEDYDRIVSMGSWRAYKPRHVWYAHTSIVVDNKIKHMQMHRAIIDVPMTLDIDHIDGDGLNNQKYNLRSSTRSQNLANRPRCVSQTGYRGVQPENKSTHFIAQITVNKKRIWLGNFVTKEEAAKAYDEAAIFHFGEFARLNFPPQGSSRGIFQSEESGE